VVFKNLVVHPQVVTDAHNAGCAAAKQGKFVEFKRAFWDKAFAPYQAARDPSKLGVDNIMAIAKDIGLDTTKLKADMDGPDCKAHVKADMDELAKFHVNSTPTFYINGKHLNGAMPKEAFKQIIDQQLRIAESSGVPGASYYEKEIMGKGVKQFRSKMDAGK
jgi:predicted DsbA family dithiol-disulfide isomerase